jgi:hypothetical protein
MQCKHHIQSVHMKLSYFTIKLQFNSHLTYYSHNNQKDLKLNLDRALVGQLIKIGYLLKVTIVPINYNRVQLIGLVKKGALYTVLGNLLISIRKRNRQE